jgi:hypothetical protein
LIPGLLQCELEVAQLGPDRFGHRHLNRSRPIPLAPAFPANNHCAGRFPILRQLLSGFYARLVTVSERYAEELLELVDTKKEHFMGLLLELKRGGGGQTAVTPKVKAICLWSEIDPQGNLSRAIPA